jgi:hypothetical protein
MIYQFRVTLPGIKGFYRIYKVNSANSLYHFHKQLQSDLIFPVDQPILFKAYNENQEVIARYALIDLGYGAVDDVTLGKAVADGAVCFDYYYDTQAKKRVIITLEGEEKGDAVKIPTLLPDSKGPEPAAFDNGYVAFEDLPKDRRKLPGEKSLLDLLGGDDDDEDDDEDLDDDEEDDDKPEEIYDEDEEN